MIDLDPRINAVRPDLAAEALKDQVEARAFTPGRPAQVARGVADLRREPSRRSGLDTQLLFGEKIQVFDTSESDGRRWAWVQNSSDGYVGYVEADHLAEQIHDPSHRVTALRTFVYPEPDLKAPILDCLSMTALVRVGKTRDRFSEIAGGGWVCGRHLAALEDRQPDYTATAQAFLGAPYLWGGRQSLGLDCSALVQLALMRAGFSCPRDSDMQARALGQKLGAGGSAYVPKAGDLIYLPDHVAIGLDERRVVHASAYHMQVVIESLADLMTRVASDSGRAVDQTIDVVRRPAATPKL